MHEGASPEWAETRSGSVCLRIAPGPEGHAHAAEKGHYHI
jgi:hypothetical protein